MEITQRRCGVLLGYVSISVKEGHFAYILVLDWIQLGWLNPKSSMGVSIFLHIRFTITLFSAYSSSISSCLETSAVD